MRFHRALHSRDANTLHLRCASSLFVMLLSFASAIAQEPASRKNWTTTEPGAVGLDAATLTSFDADLASGKYGLVDSMLAIRCGKLAYEHAYPHDYGKIYGERAKTEGPLNHDLKGPYNYFNSEFHPYYRHSDLHTMQSISKTVTSITIGVAIARKEFPADLDTPILKYFDGYKIANVDDRKQRITLRHLLTMTAGLEWHEDLAYDDPKNSADVMEATRDWVQYVIGQPMAAEPGTVFVYNSGVTQLLSHIFKKTTGKNIDDYAAEYVFKPLGMRYHWKRSPTGLADTEGGLYLASEDLAKLGYLFLKNGMWDGKQIVPADWIKDSVAPHIGVGEDAWKYGYQWWLVPYDKASGKLAWAAHGFGGQQLIIVPEYDLIVVFTGWDILPSKEEHKHDALQRILSAVDKGYSCASPKN